MKHNGISHSPIQPLAGIEHKNLKMENPVKDNLESLFERAGDYLETRIDLYKLKAVDKSSDIISSLVSKLIVLMAFFLCTIIVNIGIGLLLGELLGKTYYGFFVLAGVYLIIGIIFNSMRKKWFKDPIVDKLITKFF